jgi:hypothetical protein
MRRELPQRRHCQTFNLEFWGQLWHVTVGYYDFEMNEPGEIFVNAGKRAGTDLDVMTRDASILFSLLLQHGVSLSELSHSLTRNQAGGPGGIMGAIADKLK